ncbi:MAG: hypothetical protein A2Y38_02390 [Spirochaetes bacterium GWB1_59_5]|nr:MAG: hypothetical protein A2Y38_02390 [Spirochaetes bacterium GWB1_59_5]
MNSCGDRAVLVGTAYLGLGTLDPGAGAMRVLAWSEAPDGRTLTCHVETIPAENVAFNAALSPYRFGLHAYDPFQSLANSLDRAAEQGASLSLAVWAAMEANLFRFAFDIDFTKALDEARGTEEWLRFARLNALYRACVMALAPLGIVPPSWNAWLRGDSPSRFPAQGFGKALERFLTRPVYRLAETVRGSTDAC